MEMTKGQRLRQQIALLLLGAVAGAGGMMWANGKTIDGLYLKQAHLTLLYDDLAHELDHAEQQLNLLTAQSSRNIANPTLRNIKITVNNDSPTIQLEVAKVVKASLDFLIGTQVRVFADAPTVITKVVDRKSLTVNGRSIQMSLSSAVLLNDTLYVTVDARIMP